MRNKRFFAMLLALTMLLTMAVGCSKPAEEPEETADFIGAVTDGTYYNPYFDFSFTAPEDWTYFSEEELLEVAGATTEMVGENLGEAFSEQLEHAGTTYVMLVDAPTGENVNIVVQKTQEGLKELSDDILYSLLKPTVETQLQQTGLAGAKVNVDSTTFLGETRTALYTTIDSLGMVQKQLYIIKDTYSCTITVSARDAASADAMMAMFHN